MKKDPVRAVGIMVYLLGIVMVILPIISIFEKKKTPEWILGLIFLFCSMCVVSAAIKHVAKRIDELEKKLEVSKSEAS